MSDFLHLHNHSHYSLLNALPKIPELVTVAKKYEMPAIALTDNGNLYGAIEFYKECIKQDIKPIIGVDFYVALRTRHDKEAGIDNRRSRLVLLAKNQTGYRNLIKLVTKSHLEGFYYKPRIDHELMREHADGLVCVIPSFRGEITAELRGGDVNGARDKLSMYKEIFKNENVFLEVTHHPEIEGHEKLQDNIIAIGNSTSTPLVAAHDTYYINPEDRPARDTLLSVQSNVGLRERGNLTRDEEDFSFISPDEIATRFRETPEAILNTKKIADMCNLTIELGTWLFPKLDIPENTTYESELDRLVNAGIKRRDIKDTKQVSGRAEYELNVINGKGYAPYFLVVADLMRYAHQHNILTNTRGSAAGSLVSYALGITNIDPIEYEIPFERFLNPERPSPPDIDIDIADNRRDELIAYVREKYGEDRVAQIGTFGTMLARGSVRDTARALGYDYATGDRVAKLIPFGSQGFPMSIDRALKEEPDLAKLYKQDEDAKIIIDMAKKIEGCARHISVHAAGVVISPQTLTDIVPLQQDPKGEDKLITQYDMYSVAGEEGGVGLVKFDLLGLKNLAILADAIQRVKKLLDIDIDVDELPLNDTKTFDMLARGETLGVFQLAGQAMTKFLKELKPSTIHDINAMVALFRPGPMRNIPHYIARKHGTEPVKYIHPKMEKFLDKSYGILVYQEDLLLTAINVAGYTWKTVDKFRKAVGKKIPKEMERQHKIFVDGCIEQSGMSAAEAENLWGLIEPFAAYAFNKAHAASYGRVSYQTAYMKAHYPVIYMATLLTADSGNTEKIAEIVGECKRMDIDVLPPNVNESLGVFTVVLDDKEKIESAVRFGLYSIKNFGEGIADVIIAERKSYGLFKSLSDFLERINDRNLNKKSLEALICCGALDEFGERGQMLESVDELLSHARAGNNQPDGQDSLFSMMEDTTTVPKLQLKNSEPVTQEQRLVWEKELLGLYISGHPLERWQEKIIESGTDIETLKQEVSPGYNTGFIGVIEDCRHINTKNGEHMAFVRMSDLTGSIETVVFPKLYRKCKDVLDKKGCVSVTGIVSDRGGELSLITESIKELSTST